MIKALLAVAAGGACGAVARYLVYLAAAPLLGAHFPFATLIVNVVGSFCLGLFVELAALVWSPGASLRLFLVTGVLGSFTTFSTFSLDFAVLYERGRFLSCACYLLGSVACSIGAFFAALYLVRCLAGARL